MALASNIQRRPGSANYYARLGVPSDLQAVLGKTELWKSLRTSDPREARTRAAPLLAQWHVEFDELRRRRAPTPADLEGAVWDHYRGSLEEDRNARMRAPTEIETTAAKGQALADIATMQGPRDAWSMFEAAVPYLLKRDHVALDRDMRARRKAEVKHHLAMGETALIAWAADDLIERERLLIGKGSPAYRDLCHRLLRAELEALEAMDRRDDGEWSHKPRDELVRPPLHVVATNQHATPGEAIMELYQRFKRENPGAVSGDTWNQNEKIVKLFAEFVGEAAHHSAINRKNVREWKNKLFEWPVKAAEIKAFAGMDFRAVLKANQAVGKPVISGKTINKYLSALGGFCTWLQRNDFITEDVMNGMYLDLDRRKRTRFPYTVDQLNTILASPLFRTCMGDKREDQPGNVAVRDWRYWIPLVALFTGARLGEIAQLATTDVRQSHGVWIFHFTEEGEGEKSTKTEGSMRVVPMHPELVQLGFLDYHADIGRRGAKQLFPEIKPDARGFMSGTPSTFFNDYFRAIGVKVDETVNFHSFRHGIADAFRRAGYLDEQFAMLFGHTKHSTTQRYGIMPEGPLLERLKMIEAVSYPGLSLDHLRPTAT